jgi:hypothetical protein
MKGIKVLQAATVLTFALIVGVGFGIVFFAPAKMTAFVQLVNSIWPLFVAEVIPAFLGTPLKEFVKGKNAEK